MTNVNKLFLAVENSLNSV